MRIAYCTNVRLPNERAHGHQVARVTDALATLGHDVTIFTPFRRNVIVLDYHTFHRAHASVRLRYLGYFDPIDRWFIPKIFQLPLLNRHFCGELQAVLGTESFDLLYTRTPVLLPTLLSTKKPVIMELHTLPNTGRSAFVNACNRCAKVICLTSPMRDALVEWGVRRDITLVEHDGIESVMLSTGTPLPLKNVPKEVALLGYAGQLQSMGLSKGIPELLDAVDMLTTQGTSAHLLLAGPEAADATLMKRIHSAAHVTYLGFLPHPEVAALLQTCSVLIYPAPASRHPFYQRDTSPLKLFEYMATGKPIVAADLPPIRDVVDESIAYMCLPGDAQDLARAVQEALDHPDEALRKAAAAKQKVTQYTWEKRMQRILETVRIRA